MITCVSCQNIFQTLEDYAAHKCTNTQHVDDKPSTNKKRKKWDRIKCNKCHNIFQTLEDFVDHACTIKRGSDDEEKKVQVGRGRRRSLGGHVQQEIFKAENDADLLLEMRQQEKSIRQHLLLKLNNGMKWYIIISAQFKKIVQAEDGTMVEKLESNFLSTQTFKAFNQMDIDNDLPTAYKDLFTKFDEQERQGSGWVLDKILQIEVHTATLEPLQASSYIESPKR